VLMMVPLLRVWMDFAREWGHVIAATRECFGE